MVKAIFESLEIDGGDEAAEELEEGSQVVVVNCYPPCPEPELTPSNYGFLTLLLQDDVEGLQILYRDEWVTVDPIPGFFVVNVGDHLENDMLLYSEDEVTRYKSVLHRVLVNSTKPRRSVASMQSFPLTSVVKPSPKLVDEHNPPQYMDTEFATFLEYVFSREPKWKFSSIMQDHYIR
ncbi:putative flavanone 3-dioxygenase [Arabidopsis thaliana]